MRTAPDPARAGRGIGWLVLALVVVGLAASIAFAPGFWRGSLGQARIPSGDGPEPRTPADAQAALAQRKPTTGLGGLGQVQVRIDPPAVDTPVQVATETAAAAKERTYPGEERAKAFLAEAETHYTAMAWTKARSAADRIAQLDATPRTLSRAKDISRGAAALARLFDSLNDEDELSRNYDTHPSLVLIGTGTTQVEAVPLAGNTTPPIAITDQDPLIFIDEARRAGKVWFMVKGIKKFNKAEYDSTRIGDPAAVDVAARIQERARDLDEDVTRIRNDAALASDATAWYELGKFAYRNRLDSRVVGLLDHALLLEPNLAARVRNDKAALIAASVMLHLRNNDRTRAAPFMATLRGARFKDTEAARMAAAEWDGKTAEMVAIAKAMDAKRRQEETERLAELKRRAEEKKKAGDEAAAAALEKASEQPEEPEAPAGGDDAGSDAPLASGDEAKADDLATKGRKLAAEAVEMPAGKARNAKYAAALPLLVQAVKIYDKILTKGDNARVQEKLVAANQMAFLCRKSQTASH
ncbi:MAG: hypothetical protein RLZZ127_222 [Planctomycetota bacterium]|jgi:hypothetical protein